MIEDDGYFENMALSLYRSYGDGANDSVVMNFDGGYLPVVVNKMAEFLRAVGYNYVAQVVVITDEGKEYVSDM